jgi:penicillin-binding protein 1C
MEEVERPEEEGNWRDFTGKGKIAWKTGTSYGFRDAWAVGVNAKYVVAVWVGNADGEGRPGIIGIEAAAPILFDLFGMLNSGAEWFDPPFDDLRQIDVCSRSGMRALDACEEKTSQWIPASGLRTLPCAYHKEVHLDASEKFQVHSDCESPSAMVHKSWFVLPPAEEEYYRNKHADYKPLPPFREDCKAMIQSLLSTKNMEFIYPRHATRIYVPVELDGSPGSTVFEITHRDENVKIHWHLDNQYVGTTETFHQVALRPRAGTHILTAVDENGEQIQQRFEILNREEEKE